MGRNHLPRNKDGASGPSRIRAPRISPLWIWLILLIFFAKNGPFVHLSPGRDDDLELVPHEFDVDRPEKVEGDPALAVGLVARAPLAPALEAFTLLERFDRDARLTRL